MKWEEKRLTLVRDIGRMLVKTKAIRFGTFTLSSGRLSPYYIDLRIVPSFPDVFSLAVTAYKAVIQNLIGLDKVEAIGGVPTSGLTYASAVAYSVRKPLIYVREEKKAHGTAKKVEGLLKPGSTVVMLDDLVTTGTSLIKSTDTIRSEGGEVKDAVALIDRMERGKENLAEKGVRLHTITDIRELADLLCDMGIIDAQQNRSIKSQIKK